MGLNSTVVGSGGFMIINLMITGCGFELYCSWKWRLHVGQSLGLNSTVIGIGGFMIVNLMITGCWFELNCSWN